MAPFLDSNFYYGTTSTAALFAGAAGPNYTVNGSDPATVADFAGVKNSGAEYYRTAGSATTFADMFTYSDTGSLGTMVDSDGALKWKPHNYLLQSEDFTTTWSATGLPAAVVTPNQATSPDGTLTGDEYADNNGRIQQSVTIPSNCTVKFCVWAQENTSSEIQLWSTHDTTAGRAVFNLSTGTVTTDVSGVSAATIEADGDWYLCTVEGAQTTGGSVTFIIEGDATANTRFIWGAHAYRSDLGGTVENPDRTGVGAEYVPTTSAARFLARRNHYRYNGASYSKKGILLESAAATNLIPNSTSIVTDFAEASVDTLAIEAGETGPDGQESAWALTPNTSSAQHYMTIDATLNVTAAAYTFSIYAKADGYQYIFFNTNGTGAVVNDICFFDLSGGTVVSEQSGVNAEIEPVGGGWFRCSATWTFGSSVTLGSLWVAVSNTSSNTGAYAGDGTSQVLVYGPQFELGSVPTSYVSSNINATVTRAAETLTIAGSDMAASTTAMSFHMEGELSYADLGVSAQIRPMYWYVGGSDYLEWAIDTNSTLTGRPRIIQRQLSSGLDQVLAADVYTPGLNKPFNIATRNTNGAVNIAVDGTASTEDATPTAMADFSSVAFQLGVGASAFTGTIALFRQDDSDWGDTAIADITA